MTPLQLEFQQQQNREQHRSALDEITPRQLEFWQQQDQDRHRQVLADSTPEQLEMRQQQDPDQNCSTRDDIIPQQLEVQQHQDQDPHSRAADAAAVSITQEINDSGETFSIDMMGRPTANQLENFESDQDKALLIIYENLYDHVGDLVQNLDDASPGDESNIAGQRLLNTLEDNIANGI